MRSFALGLGLGLGLVACVALPACKTTSNTEAVPAPPSAPAAPPPPTASAQISSAQPAGVMLKTLEAPPDVAAPPADAQKTASGLASKILTPGTGKDHPKPEDRVRVHYSGWTKNGEMFDSSVSRGSPAEFAVKQVIPGWTEALQVMVLGEKRRVWIPAKLAYGDRPMGGAPSGDLVFDVELLEVIQAPEPPAVPADVKAAPTSAKKTASGLAYKVLKPGTGKKPQATDSVVVHYSGWTTDGKMFDSSVVRGQPLTFRLNQVIKGWTEGVQLMKVGEKARFWIPGNLAYGDKPSRPGAPAGMLVFDIELIDVPGSAQPAAPAH